MRPHSVAVGAETVLCGSATTAAARRGQFAAVAGLLGSVAALCLGSTVAAAGAYVRVSQIGYEAGAPMRAYLMSTSALAGEKFTVRSAAGKSVAAGSVGGDLGGWGSYRVYPIDFSLAATGSYRITVGGTVAVASPPFAVGPPASLYGSLLANTLRFYQNERDGADYIGSELRQAPGHLNDANAVVYRTPSFDKAGNIVGALASTGATIDASGGWWDAGDYLKFVETASYTVALMAIGIRDFPEQMGAGSAASDFTAEARFGLDWLRRMWDEAHRTLAYQVGIGSDFQSYGYQSDHDIWRLPQADDSYRGSDPTYRYIRHRPVFRAGAPGAPISPNLAGRLAADFALCFQIFRTTDPAYAAACLGAGETIFDLADTAPGGHLLTTSPKDFYPETEWRDDLELGAVELYFALAGGHLPAGLPHTDPGFYLAQAADWARAYIRGPGDRGDTLNLYDVSGLAHFELYRAIAAARQPGLAVSPADLLTDLAGQMTASAAAARDPFGAGYKWSLGDTTSHLSGLSVMAKEYFWLTGDPLYETLSRQWLANVFGANAWGTSLIIGAGTTFPDCPQHQVANILGSLTGGTPILAGAAVEGPNSAASSGRLTGMGACPPGGGDRFRQFNGRGAVYEDNVQSFTTVEPAIDLAAASMLMYSWRIAGAPRATP
jgi:endoglucanase